MHRNRLITLVLCSAALIAVFAFRVPSTHAAIAFVSSTTADDVTGTSLPSLAASAMNVTAGNFLFVSCGANGSGNATVTASDTAANSFTALDTVNDSTNGSQVRAFYAKNVTGNASDAVRCSYSPSQAFVDVNALQYSGVDTSAPLDVQSTSTIPQTATTLSSRLFTTSNADDVLIAAYDQGGCGSTAVAGNTYTRRSADPDGCSATEDKIVSATQTNTSSSFTGLPAAAHVLASAAFKATAAGGGGVPGAPGTPTYTSLSTSTFTVNWTSASGSPTYYNVDRSPSANGTYAEITTTTSLSYGDTGLSASTTYWYKIAATNGSGTGAFSATSTVTTLLGVPDQPAAPTFTSIGTSTLTANWAVVATSVTSYTLKRSASANGTYNTVSSTAALSFTDTGLATSTQYWYEVAATNASGTGAYSPTSTVTTLSGGPCGSSNISSSTSDHWAWNDTIGWIDFCTTGTVNVTSTGITGYASSSIGDISFDCATTRAGNICNGTNNYQVTNDGSGNLSNYGWNDAYGWISFDCNNGGSGCGTSQYQVTIDTTGMFSNYAWNDDIGWISFNCANSAGSGCNASSYDVQSSWLSTGGTATTGYLDSTTYDTGVTSGAQLNSFIWHGSLPSGTTVSLQFAVSNSSSGPWSYMGTDGTSNTYYTVGPDTSEPLDYSLFNNYRYFRYRVTLYSNAAKTQTPQVDEVVVNWSP